MTRWCRGEGPPRHQGPPPRAIDDEHALEPAKRPYDLLHAWVTDAIRYGGAPVRLRLIRMHNLIVEVSDGGL
ncbi:hypothetical protein [Streptomyces avermitilis]|uniref:hypothetical protein n=1 Tax=Streptomyces avermitilis TaxID=33903 RepID=UPI0038265F66